MKKRDNFSPGIVEALAKRASYICSNPSCRSLTLFPSNHAATKTIFLGIAAHISAAAQGGPRYDPLLTPEQRSSIENGIFLCTTCASVIDKNNGVDFPTETLICWKNEHEAWVRNSLNRSVTSLADSIQSINEQNRRKDILYALVHELYVNLNILLDNKFNPTDEQLGKPYVYPRLMVSTADNAIALETV